MNKGRGLGFLLIIWVALLTGCASMMGLDVDPSRSAEAPVYQVGDRWVYHVEDGYRNPDVWEETHEIIAIDERGIVFQVTRKGLHINDQRQQMLAAPGLVTQGALLMSETRRFQPAWVRFRYPMHAGDSWSQRLRADVNNDAENRRRGHPAVATHALGWEKLPSPSGELDALRLRVNVLFDDDNYWRHSARGSYDVWYAPAVSGVLKAEKYASYIERGDYPGSVEIPLVHATFTLKAYSRASQ